MDSTVIDRALFEEMSVQQTKTSSRNLLHSLRLATNYFSLIPLLIVLLLIADEMSGTILLFDPKRTAVIIIMNILFAFHIWTRFKLNMVMKSNLLYITGATALFWMLAFMHVIVGWIEALTDMLF